MTQSAEAEHLAAFGQYVLVRGFDAYLAEDRASLKVTNTGTGGQLEVVCQPRSDDDGRLWLLTSDGTPLAEADQIVNASVALMGLLPTPCSKAER